MGVSEKYQVAKEYVRESPLFSVCVHTCAHTSVTAQLQCEIVHFSVVWCEGMADGLTEGKYTVGGGIGKEKVKGIGNKGWGGWKRNRCDPLKPT